MSNTNERRKVNPNLQEAVPAPRTDERMGQSSTTPDAAKPTMASRLESFPEPSILIHDVPRPSPTPYPCRTRLRTQEAAKGDIVDGTNPIAPINAKNATREYYARPANASENIDVTNRNAESVPQRRGAIRRQKTSPPMQRGEHACATEKPPQYPISTRSPITSTFHTSRRIRAQVATEDSETAQEGTYFPLQGQKLIGALPPLTTDCIRPDTAHPTSQSPRRDNKQVGVLSTRMRRAQTLPTSAGAHGPARTFDDLLKEVLPTGPESSLAPPSPAPSTASSIISSLNLKSLTDSTRRGIVKAGKLALEKSRPVLKKGQQIITPRISAMRRAESFPIISTIRSKNKSRVAMPLAQAKRAVERNRSKWTCDLPEPVIPTGAEEICEVERLLAMQPGFPDQSPSWNLARHSWKSMDLRTQYEHHYPKTENSEDENEAARKSRWNRLEARRRVRVRSQVQEDFIGSWEAWVSEQNAEVQAEARNSKNEQDEGDHELPPLPNLWEATLVNYFTRCLREVDDAFERQKNLAEQLVKRDASRFPGML